MTLKWGETTWGKMDWSGNFAALLQTLYITIPRCNLWVFSNIFS